MAQTLELTVTRAGQNQPWGFRLQGGKDFNMPIIIQKVNGGSPAELAGMHAGDAVIAIGGFSAIDMRHKEVQDAVVRSGNTLKLVVQRGGQASLRLPPSAVQTPKRTQPVRPRNPFSVAKNIETPDGTVKALVHNQFNSPLPLYSEEKIAETLSAQAEVLAGGALGVDFKKNERKFDSNMSDVLRMVQEMDSTPEAFAEPPPDEIDPADLPAEYKGLNSIKSRSMRSLMVRPGDAGTPQTSVHAPRINPPAPAPKMAPVPPPKPGLAGPTRGPPGMRSTTATMIKADPITGNVKLISAVDTETKHFNAFNRSPRSFKSQPISSYQPGPAPSHMAHQQQQQHHFQQQQQHHFQQQQQHHFQQQQQQHVQQQQQQQQPSSGLSQVDYSSYVPQKKGGTTFVWPPPPTEEEPAAPPQPFAGGHVEVARPAPAPAPVPAPKPAAPPVPPKPAPAPAFPPAPKQVSFGQPGAFAPPAAPMPKPVPSMGAPPKLDFNNGLGGGAAPGGGRGSTAGRTNAPRRGRGQRNAAGSGTRVPICSTCGNQIRGPFITALGQCWCPGCFVCTTPSCRQNLESIGFVEVDDKIHCENCWERHLAPVCNKCNKRIKEDCLKAIGKSYHPECFACAYCGGLFGNSAFFLEDGLPYCENDWNELFTTKCVGCGFPIEAGDRWVEALNKNFHAQCFKCAICGNNLEGQSFYAKQGRPFCKHHARV